MLKKLFVKDYEELMLKIHNQESLFLDKANENIKNHHIRDYRIMIEAVEVKKTIEEIKL